MMPRDTDPTALLAQLDADELRRRLDQLEGERAAVLLLLRAARAKERAERRRQTQQGVPRE
jgi:hypothetical protein